MNLRELEEFIPAALDSGISIELISPPGLGKSDFVAQTKDKMSKKTGVEWGLSKAFLATYTPPDMVGYQFKGERIFPGINDGKPVTVTDASMPLWMLTEDGRPINSFKRGIVFLDEFGQGEPDVKRAAAELLLNKKIGPWVLHEGISVMAASNRSIDRSGVTKSFDFVINRRMEIPLVHDVVGWTSWATDAGVTPLVISFANAFPNVVFTDTVPEKQGPWCTPRTIAMVDKLFRSIGGSIPDSPALKEMVAGLIGAGAMAQMFTHIQLEREMPRYESIVNDPEGVKVPSKPDALMLIAYNLAHRVNLTDVGAVAKYMQRMPKEFAVTFMHAACRRVPEIVNSPAVVKWCSVNASLMTAISRNQ